MIERRAKVIVLIPDAYCPSTRFFCVDIQAERIIYL